MSSATPPPSPDTPEPSSPEQAATTNETSAAPEPQTRTASAATEPAPFDDLSDFSLPEPDNFGPVPSPAAPPATEAFPAKSADEEIFTADDGDTNLENEDAEPEDDDANPEDDDLEPDDDSLEPEDEDMEPKAAAAFGKAGPGIPAGTPPRKGGAYQPADQHSFFQTHPILTLPPSMEPSIVTWLYNAMGFLPWLFITALFVGQTILTLDARALWFSDEIRHANAFTSMLESGKWFVLHMNGEIYPDKPPLYFWFLRGIYEVLKQEGPMLYMVAAAVSGLLYLWASLGLARIVGRSDGRTMLATGIILASCGYFIGVTHYARMDLLFSVFIILSHIAFFVAFTQKRATFLMVMAFAFAGMACLVKGPLGLALPLATSVLFLLWRGKPLRLFSFDFFVGIIAGCLVVGGWLAGVVQETGSTDFIVNELWGKQVVQRAVAAFHHAEPWQYYLIRFPLMLLPWVLVLFCLPYHRILGKTSRTAIGASRRPEKEGLAFLWCMVLATLALLSVLSTKILIYLLPVLPAMAILGARAVLQLAGMRAAFFRFLLIVFFITGGAALFVVSLALFGLMPLPDMISLPNWNLPFDPAFPIVAGVVLLTGFALWLLLPSSRPEGVLIILAIFAVILCFPLYKLAAPTLDAVLSPKAQAEVMKSYIAKGYSPLSYRVYGGTYTYYAGKPVKELKNLDEVQAMLDGGKKVVLGIRTSQLAEWQNKPECLVEVHKQWIETRQYSLLVCPKPEAPAEAKAADPAAKPDLPAAPAKDAPAAPAVEAPAPAVEAPAAPAVEAPAPAAPAAEAPTPAAPAVEAPAPAAPAAPAGEARP